MIVRSQGVLLFNSHIVRMNNSNSSLLNIFIMVRLKSIEIDYGK